MSPLPIDISFANGPVTWRQAPIHAGCGGECVFLGRTRAETHATHGPLELLRYTAYESMALRVLDQLARKAIDDHSALFVRIHHSLGDVAIGEASVFIQVLCPHRAEAFAACRMLIDRLKSEAPIWKSEVWSDGATWSTGQQIAPEVFADHHGEVDDDEEESWP